MHDCLICNYRIKSIRFSSSKEHRIFFRSLGFTVGVATRQSKFGYVPSDFSLDNVQCVGTESWVGDCPHSVKDNCDWSEGAGVKCGQIGILSLNVFTDPLLFRGLWS